MSKIQTINLLDLIDKTKKINNPFSRELFITTIKDTIGEGVMIKYDMGNGIAIFARSFLVFEDTILIEESNVPAGVFIFNLGENLLFKYKDKKEHILQKNNFLAALASDKFCSEVILEKNKRYTTVTIGMKEELFLNLSQPIENIHEHIKKAGKDSYALLKNDDIDPRQSELLSYFNDQATFEDLLKNLFLESKITDLCQYTFKRVVNKPKNNQINLNKNRIKSLQKAREVILKEYDQELSIKDIAHKAATNECYLKKDFKVYYGVTVFEMLQKHRMESAKQLLQTDLGVKQTATKVGYKHSGNFSKIFFKYFGISPSNYKKNFLNI